MTTASSSFENGLVEDTTKINQLLRAMQQWGQIGQDAELQDMPMVEIFYTDAVAEFVLDFRYCDNSHLTPDF